MLGIEIALLADRYTATKHDDRSSAEWPPHPARLFSALVAAWADVDEPDAGERAALAWLEALDPPEITCDPNPARRAVVDVYVPVNDAFAGGNLNAAYAALTDAEVAVALAATPAESTRAGKALVKARAKAVKDSKSAGQKAQGGVSIVPESRIKQARTFPTVVPAVSVVSMWWPEAEVGDHLGALDALAGRVGRLGHSSTLVSCRALTERPVDDDALATFTPTGDPGLAVRVPAAGLVDLLEAAHAEHRGVEPRVLPAAQTSYAVQGAAHVLHHAPLLGGPWVVLAMPSRPRLSVTRSLDVAAAVRGALMHHAPEPVAQLLSGHLPRASSDDGRTAPAHAPHLAVVPLASVGHAQSTGHLLGVALVLPSEVAGDERAQLDAALDAWRAAGGDGVRLPLRVVGRATALELDLRVVEGHVPTATLRRSTWCRPATDFLSVTPIALDRFPKHLFSNDADRRAAGETAAAAEIAAAVVRAGLPLPAEVVVQTAGPMAGIADSGSFPQFVTGLGNQRRPRLVIHARIRFATAVVGPVLVGAARYRGYGLCLPVDAGIA